MVEAVLGGEGLGRVAELASEAAGGPVAIVVPRLGVAVAAPAASPAAAALPALRRYAGDRVKDRPVEVPNALVAEATIATGDDVVGIVALVAGNGPAVPEAAEYLHLAAVASLTEVAVEEAKDEVEQNLRGSFLEDLRSRPDLDPREVVRRAGRLGCDLSRGVVVLCAELRTDRPRHVVATIAEEFPGALAQHLDGRVYALLPAAGADDAPETTLSTARRLATRLQRHGTVGLSSFYADPGDFPRAIQEAELVLDVLRQSDAPIAEDIGTGTYRLLFRVLASHPEEVRSFYEDTAAAIYAHCHTLAYRLDRVRELTGWIRCSPRTASDSGWA
jgi:sugar diacid utilization regulator